MTGSARKMGFRFCLLGFLRSGKGYDMYKVNDRIVYGTHGVCEVTAVGRLSMSAADGKRKYYTLRPIYQKDSLIYVPVDNVKVPMRRVLTKEETDQLMEEIPTLDTIWISNEREREMQYKEAVLSGDCHALVRIIKTLYLRRKSRMESGKKVAAVDERYFRQAEDLLYGELAFVLGMDRDDIAPYISSHIEREQPTVSSVVSK